MTGCGPTTRPRSPKSGEVKTRLWLVYLGGCSIAFERNTVKIYQTVTTRAARGPAGLPPTRADLYRQAD
jgi:cyclopropane-fatty-acyl-phospholipid synthase